MFWCLFRQELWLWIRYPSAFMNPLIFFSLVMLLFPLAIGPEPLMLRQLAPGCIWVVALLAVLLSLEGLFRGDVEDGSLEQWVVSGRALSGLVLAKLLAHWFFSGLPLVVLAPVWALMLGFDSSLLPVLGLSLLLGTPVLSFLGAIGAALTLGLKRGGLLLALLILPLYIPVLIFGTGALHASLQGFSAVGHLLWLASLTVLALTLAPLAIAAGLKIGLGE